MRTPSTDIFGPVEENNDENIEKEEEEEVKRNRKKRSLKRKRLAAPKRKKKRTTTMNRIRGARYVKKSEKISKKPTWKKSNSSWIEENPNTMPKMPLSTPCYLQVEEG